VKKKANTHPGPDQAEVTKGNQPAKERRSAEATLRTLIARLAPKRVRLVGTIRRHLRKSLPTALEVVYEYRDFLVISFSPSPRGYEGVLGIRADPLGVRLYFNQGKALADPRKLLQGSGKQTRWLAVESASLLNLPTVNALISGAIHHSSVPFPKTGPGSLVFRTGSAKEK